MERDRGLRENITPSVDGEREIGTERGRGGGAGVEGETERAETFTPPRARFGMYRYNLISEVICQFTGRARCNLADEGACLSNGEQLGRGWLYVT